MVRPRVCPLQAVPIVSLQAVPLSPLNSRPDLPNLSLPVPARGRSFLNHFPKPVLTRTCFRICCRVKPEPETLTPSCSLSSQDLGCLKGLYAVLRAFAGCALLAACLLRGGRIHPAQSEGALDWIAKVPASDQVAVVILNSRQKKKKSPWAENII